MLEKTFTTFHASNVLLQQQYRERRFTEYSQLISCLLVAEQNNELLMKNHQSRPTGSEAFPEVNAISSQNYGRGRGREDVVVVEVEGGIPDNIIIILLIRKEKLRFTTRSGIIMSLNKKMEKVQRKNPRPLKTHVIDVVWKDTGLVPVVRPSI